MSIPIPIVVGVYHLRLRTGGGEFFCPWCQSEARYEQKEIRACCFLCFIPYIPLCKEAEYIKCVWCHSKFTPYVLEVSKRHYEAQEQHVRIKRAMPLWQRAMLKVMVRVMKADGQVCNNEVSTIQKFFKELSGTTLNREIVMGEASEMEAKPENDVETDLAPFAPILSKEGKDLVLKGMCLVAWADDEVNQDERRLIDQAGCTLGLPGQDVEQILQEAEKLASPHALRRQEVAQMIQKANNGKLYEKAEV